jgi:hypothetical protein
MTHKARSSNDLELDFHEHFRQGFSRLRRAPLPGG